MEKKNAPGGHTAPGMDSGHTCPCESCIAHSWTTSASEPWVAALRDALGAGEQTQSQQLLRLLGTWFAQFVSDSSWMSLWRSSPGDISPTAAVELLRAAEDHGPGGQQRGVASAQ